MTARRITTILIALAATAGPAGAQDPQQRIAAALDRARAAGLPVELLESKLAEGRAKNVPLDRIAAAIDTRASALHRAATVLRNALPDEPIPAADIAVGADALQAGVDEAVLARLAGTAGRHRRTVALAALTHLVAAGARPDEALRRVENAMRRGDQALMDLPGMGGHNTMQGPPAGMPPAGRPAGSGHPRQGGGGPGSGGPGGGGGGAGGGA